MKSERPGFPHTFFQFLNQGVGYKKALHAFGGLRKGVNLLTQEWDICIILDACRSDVLQHLFDNDWSPPRNGTWESIISLDSATQPWARKTFQSHVTPKQLSIIYVSANPHSTEAYGSDHVDSLDEVWQYGWENRLGTVPPRVVTDRAIHHYRTRKQRVMVHYIQPHVPFLTRKNGELVPYFDSFDRRETDRGQSSIDSECASSKLKEFEIDNVSSHVFDLLRRGELSHHSAWEAYEETLHIVLEEVTFLLHSIDANQVVITADHGNAFGEWGLFGHPYHMPFSVLREVPYITTVANAENGYEPAEYNINDKNGGIENSAAFESKLRALGYVK